MFGPLADAFAVGVPITIVGGLVGFLIGNENVGAVRGGTAVIAYRKDDWDNFYYGVRDPDDQGTQRLALNNPVQLETNQRSGR